MYMYMRTYMCAHICTVIQSHTYTHTHIHTCTRADYYLLTQLCVWHLSTKSYGASMAPKVEAGASLCDDLRLRRRALVGHEAPPGSPNPLPVLGRNAGLPILP